MLIILLSYILSLSVCITIGYQHTTRRSVYMSNKIKLSDTINQLLFNQTHCINQYVNDTFIVTTCQKEIQGYYDDTTESDIYSTKYFGLYSDYMNDLVFYINENLILNLNELKTEQFDQVEKNKITIKDVQSLKAYTVCLRSFEHKLVETFESNIKRSQKRIQTAGLLQKKRENCNLNQYYYIKNIIKYVTLESIKYLLDIFQQQQDQRIKNAQNLKCQYTLEKDFQNLLENSLKKVQERMNVLDAFYKPKKELINKGAFINQAKNQYPIKKALLLSDTYQFEIRDDIDITVNFRPEYMFTNFEDGGEFFEGLIHPYKVQAAFQDLNQVHQKQIQVKNFIEYDKVTNYSSGIKSHQFFKKTYTLNLNSSEVTESEKEFLERGLSDRIYIEKMPQLSLGYGIYVQTNITQYIQNVKDCKFNRDKNATCVYDKFYEDKSENFNYTVLLQEYLTPLLLIKNRKFDIRSHVLVFYTGTHYMYWFQNGMVRCSVYPFDMNSNEKMVHTTHTDHCNEYLYSKKMYKECIRKAQYSLQEFDDILREERNITDKELHYLKTNQKQVITYALLSDFRKMKTPKKGQFHLFGCDTIFDTSYKAWFLECNAYPGIYYTTPAKEVAMPKIAKNTVNIVMYLQDHWFEMDELAKNPERIPNGEMDLIYNDATGYNIIDEKI